MNEHEWQLEFIVGQKIKRTGYEKTDSGESVYIIELDNGVKMRAIGTPEIDNRSTCMEIEFPDTFSVAGASLETGEPA